LGEKEESAPVRETRRMYLAHSEGGKSLGVAVKELVRATGLEPANKRGRVLTWERDL